MALSPAPRTQRLDGSGGLGLAFRPRIATVTVRGGDKGRGEVVEFDLPQADAAVTSLTLEALLSGFANVVAPTAAGVKGGGVHGVMLEDVSDDKRGRCMIEGVCLARTKKASGSNSAARGDCAVVATDGTLDLLFAAGEVYRALLLSEYSGSPPLSSDLRRVLFSGVTPFGTYVTSTIGGGSGDYSAAGGGGSNA